MNTVSSVEALLRRVEPAPFGCRSEPARSNAEWGKL